LTPVSNRKAENFTATTHHGNRRSNHFSVRRPGWPSKKYRRKTFRRFFDYQIALAAAIDVCDHERAFTRVWIVAADKYELFTVRRETDWTIESLHYLDWRTAKHRDAIEGAGIKVGFNDVIEILSIRRKRDAEISDRRRRHDLLVVRSTYLPDK